MDDDEDINYADEEEDWDDWQDETKQQVSCLFCDQLCTSAEAVIKHCYSEHSINIKKYCKDDDSLSYIRLMIFIRAMRPQPDDFAAWTSDGPWLLSDEYLKPENPEDPMLHYDIDDLTILKVEGDTCGGCGDQQDKKEELLVRLKEAGERALSAEHQLKMVLDDLSRMRNVAQGFMLCTATNATTVTDADAAGPSSAIKRLTRDEDAAYFQPYGHYGIHQEMLQDKVRTGAYRDFILGNPEVFLDKVVLDVGCGTGILSMFAAKAGAKRVFAVDQSDIYVQAIDIIRENQLDHVITVIHGKLEEIELPVEKVDIIISEWMGYFLLFESMLDTIIYARDRWLTDDGCVYPDIFTIRLEGSSDASLYADHVTYWDDVYGFKMTCMRDLLLNEASVDHMKSEHIITDSVVVKEIDAAVIKSSELDFTTPFVLHATREGSITAIVGYFDTVFKKMAQKKVMFSTGPSSAATHWRQTVFLLKHPISVKKGETIEGKIACKKNPQDPRSLKIRMTLNGMKMKFVVE